MARTRPVEDRYDSNADAHPFEPRFELAAAANASVNHMKLVSRERRLRGMLKRLPVLSESQSPPCCAGRAAGVREASREGRRAAFELRQMSGAAVSTRCKVMVDTNHANLHESVGPRKPSSRAALERTEASHFVAGESPPSGRKVRQCFGEEQWTFEYCPQPLFWLPFRLCCCLSSQPRVRSRRPRHRPSRRQPPETHGSRRARRMGCPTFREFGLTTPQRPYNGPRT